MNTRVVRHAFLELSLAVPLVLAVVVFTAGFLAAQQRFQSDLLRYTRSRLFMLLRRRMIWWACSNLVSNVGMQYESPHNQRKPTPF